jgi:uncharacterized LabA/DUF88 family protein
MHLYQTERVGLFIDGANLYSTVRSLGFDIDFKRLLALFAKRARLVRAMYFTALIEGEEFSPIRPLVDWLQFNGFTMVTKPVKEFADAAGRRKLKGNMDVELAVDAMRLSGLLDHIVLFSGDGNFRSLVNALQERGKRVTVISSLITRPPMIADELRRQADPIHRTRRFKAVHWARSADAGSWSRDLRLRSEPINTIAVGGRR